MYTDFSCIAIVLPTLQAYLNGWSFLYYSTIIGIYFIKVSYFQLQYNYVTLKELFKQESILNKQKTDFYLMGRYFLFTNVHQ